MAHLRILDIVAIGLYILAMLFIGWWYSRRQKSTEEYFVAGRGVNTLIVGISLIATLLSTISYMSVPGELIKNGPGMMWGMLHTPITYLIVGYLIIPFIMRQKITSAYELLEKQFGMTIRQTASVLFLFVRFSWMAFIVYTCSFAVATIINVPLYYVLAAVGIFTTAYTVIGGIRAVMMTDVVQFVILMGGGIMTIVFVMIKCGPLGWWPDWHSPQFATLHWPTIKVLSFNPFDRVTAISMIYCTVLWWVCTASSDQVAIQRYLCTRNAREARRSFLHCLLGDFVVGVVLWLVGFALVGYFLKFPGQMRFPGRSIVSQPDDLFPHFIGTILPDGLSGLVVAALFAAAMSSLSSGISSTGTVLLTDFPKIFARGCQGDDRRLVVRAKKIGVVVGLISTALSYLIFVVPGENLMDIDYRISLYFGVPLFVLFILAFYVPFSTPAGAWACIAVGFLTGVLFSFWKQIVGYFTPTGDFSIILIQPLALVFSILAGIVVSWMTRSRRQPIRALDPEQHAMITEPE